MQQLMAQLRALPAAPEKTIRFFDRRDFYCAYGDDALFVADTFNKTRATVKVRFSSLSSLSSLLFSCLMRVLSLSLLTLSSPQVPLLFSHLTVFFSPFFLSSSVAERRGVLAALSDPGSSPHARRPAPIGPGKKPVV